jgi:hypothetical protein
LLLVAVAVPKIYRIAPQNCVSLCTLCPLYRPEQGNIVGREYIN